jgi:hypothetical protein
LGVGLIGALTSGGNKTPSARGPENTPAGAQTTKNTGAAKAAQPKTAGMGDKARDGKFEFVVTGVDCTKSKVGDEFLNKTAQGKFCIVSVTVTNIGNEAQTFDGSNQTAYAGSTKFENDGTAEMYLNSDTQTFLEGINPGNTVKGKLVFDVPKSTKLTSIELHDSFFSGGVKVSLG